MIFFDLDDTILDTKNCNKKIYEKIRADLNVDMDADLFRKKLRTSLRPRMIKYFEFQYNETIGIDPLDFLLMETPYEEDHMELFKEAVWNDLKHIFKGVSKDEFYSTVLKRQHDYTDAIPGMIELLTDLSKKHKLGIVTNGLSEIQHKKVDTLGIRHLFKDVFVSGDFGYGKPDPKFYAHVIYKSGCDKENSIMIGDNPQGDVMGAISAGMKAIYFNGREVDYDLNVAHNVDELRGEIERLIG